MILKYIFKVQKEGCLFSHTPVISNGPWTLVDGEVERWLRKNARKVCLLQVFLHHDSNVEELV